MKLKNELLEHQKNAVAKLRKVKVGALFMEQGTGKTITALELCRIRIEKGTVDKIIWLCPCSAKNNIKLEILKQCPSELLSRIVICGIETLSSSIKANTYLLELVKHHKCFLVVDESLLIKNHKAIRTNNILRLGDYCTYKLILNGTPISRNAADLYSQFLLLDWRILGYRSYWSFEANHLEVDERTKRVVRSLNLNYLSEKIDPYTVKITKSDCLDLPDKNYSCKNFFLTREQMWHYEEVADKLLFELDELEPATIYRLFSGLQAVASGKQLTFFKDKNNKKNSHFKATEFFENPLDNPRIRCLINMIDTKNDDKTIIFCNYTSEITSLCSILGAKAIRFDGTISQKTRFKNINIFKNNPNVLYLLANRSCAGYSLNLQFCHKIIYFSNNWDLATRLQSEDRVHRIGQTEDIQIVDLYAEYTLDNRIADCLHRKESLADRFKNLLKESDRESIKNLVLSPNRYFKDLEDL